MRRALPALILLSVVSLSTGQPPQFYHDIEETYQILFDLQDQYPDRIEVDSVGHSEKDNMPIYLVKISDNVHVDYDRPTVLFVAHIHGEEILGIEICLEAIQQLVTYPYPLFRQRREQLEIYFMPTMNPEGLRMVFGTPDDPDQIYGPDVSYRKNKRITLNDGIFRYQVGLGNDSSGVDLNRNWGLNWFHGDTLLHYLDEAEPYDYYRGEAPFSESETRCVREAHHLVQPLYGITYHSSRSGGLSEKVYYPWDWSGDNDKLAPDQDVLDDVGSGFANSIQTLDGIHHYLPLRSESRNAKMHDWTYAEGNWLNMECEVGNMNVQPDDEDDKNDVVTANLEGIYYLIDRARGIEELEGQSGYLEVHVKDEQGAPLLAEVLTPDYWNGYLTPRYTDPLFGVQRRPLLARNYTIICRAFGYEPDTSVMNVAANGPSIYYRTLIRKPHHWLHLRALDVQGDPVPAMFIIHRDYGIDTVYAAEGDWGASMPYGHYTIETWAMNRIPRAWSFDLDEPYLMQMTLVEPDDRILDDFEGPVPDHWISSGDYIWSHSGYNVYEGTESLKSNPELWLSSNTIGSVTAHYEIPAGIETLTMTGMVAYDLEPDYDFCQVEVSVDQTNWTQVELLNGFGDWHSFQYDFRAYRENTDLYARWTVTTDGTENDRGVFLDNVALEWSGDWVGVDESAARPLRWKLYPAFPNPFNLTTTVRFDVAKTSDVKLVVYDLLGRVVATPVDERLEAGAHTRSLDLSGHASGMYFIQLGSDAYRATQKIVLMK